MQLTKICRRSKAPRKLITLSRSISSLRFRFREMEDWITNYTRLTYRDLNRCVEWIRSHWSWEVILSVMEVSNICLELVLLQSSLASFEFQLHEKFDGCLLESFNPIHLSDEPWRMTGRELAMVMAKRFISLHQQVQRARESKFPKAVAFYSRLWDEAKSRKWIQGVLDDSQERGVHMDFLNEVADYVDDIGLFKYIK